MKTVGAFLPPLRFRKLGLHSMNVGGLEESPRAELRDDGSSAILSPTLLGWVVVRLAVEVVDRFSHPARRER